MKAKVSIAVAGAGLIGRRHIEHIQKSPGCTLTGVADPSPQAKVLANALAVPHFETLEALLAHNLAEGVILATPNALHVDQALACLAAGIPTLIEKPVAQSLEGGYELDDSGGTRQCKDSGGPPPRL